jgi:trigger factor
MKLKIDIKDVNSCQKVLTIDVPSERVVEGFSHFYTSVAKQAKIPGFRPGHAPAQVVALHYREEARQEVWKQLVSQSLKEAIQQEELPVIGYPQIENVQFDETHLKYKAHLEMRPKVKIDKYTGISVKRNPVSVSETEIENSLSRLRQAHGKFQAVESRGAQMGDFLICDYRLKVDGKEVEKRDAEWIEIRDKDYLDGFSKQLVGTKAGEERTVNVIFPAGYRAKDLEGKEGRFFVTVKEIKEKQLPVLDDEFAKAASEHETLEELKKTIHRDLEQQKKMESERETERVLLEELIKKAKFDIPAPMVERRLNAMVEDAVQTLIHRGMKEEEAHTQKEAFKKNFAQDAEKQVRLSFILDEIAKREGITAHEADLFARYQMLSERARRSVEEVKAYYESSEERKELALEQIVTEKTIQWIKDKARIEEQGGRR